MAHSGKNKARNQTTGNRRGQDDATWFKKRKLANRARRKVAKAARKRNR